MVNAIPQSEQWRRAVVRIATSLLNLLIGPSAAWYAFGISGVLAYIIVHTTSKWLSAEFSARNRAIAMRNYSRSPWLLFLGGVFPFLLDVWYAPVFLVPLLLGGFEGSYWCSFHGIRFHLSQSESQGDSIDRFQIFELATTLVASLTVIFLGALSLGEIVGPLGALFSVVAWTIPMSDQARSAEMTIDSVGFSKKGVFGRKATGSFGTIQIIRTWCMRIVALQAGGITGLSIVVAISATFGFIFKIIYKRNLKVKGSSDVDIQEKQWVIGNQVTALGLLIMALSFALTSDAKITLFDNDFTFGLATFIIGYIVCNSAVDGILRPMEIEISGERLRGEGGKIGIRERTKFEQQMKLLASSLLVGLIIVILGVNPSVNVVLMFYMILAISYCGFNLYDSTLADLRSTYPREGHV